jgi:8-oxo-dGTP pyrophosphatase MutT (NUDIX family)
MNNNINTKIEPINLKIEFVNLTLGIDFSNVKVSQISAIFLIGIKDGMILAVRNERGWDIPGGHVETSDADLYSALIREVNEESGVVLKEVEPFALMRFDEKGDRSMLFYLSNVFELEEFIPKEDAFERQMMPISEFLQKYNWKKNVIQPIIEYAIKNK